VGMTPQIDQSPLPESLIQRLPQTAIAYDLIYTPRPTRFLQLAQGQGLTVIDGSEMLVQQGAAALQLWLKQSVPSDTMRQALYCYLQETA
ncbi:MAG: shikimate dehydrogenase family protein, partial [Microcystaceae cyanobacterium]